MKKILLLFLCIFIFSSFQSCKITNQYKTYEDGYDIKIAAELENHMLYLESLPILHFDMKNVNVSTTSENYKLVLVNNDYYLVSDAIANHLSYFQDNYVILDNTPQTNESKKAKFGDVELPLDDVIEDGTKQEYSREIRMVAWTADGTRYSYQFRTFVSGGKRYYAFCYSSPLTMALEQSLMVIRQNGKNKLLLIPLPFDTKYEVSGSNLTTEALLEKDTYLNDKFNTYLYPDYLSTKSLDEKIEVIKLWYEKHCNGIQTDDDFIIEYAGGRFIVEFDRTKEDGMTGNMNPAFGLKYIGSIY